jgi:SAM-dependent methyltransferase
VLIDEAASVFVLETFVNREQTFFPRRTRLQRALARRLPDLGRNFSTMRNFARLGDLLCESVPHPLVLIVGAGEEGRGISALSANRDVSVVNCDISMTRSTHVIGDAHRLPFESSFFDGVVVQAVLEHVLDPARCVGEIHRVLKPSGLVYAETPFMQPVHGGRYDFTRFTYLGHRRLFRDFEEIAAGPGGGPASSFAWSYEYFLLGLVPFERSRLVVKAFARLSAFWLKYLDLIIQNHPRSFDAAWGFYFLGRRSDHSLSDRDLIALYPSS